MKRHLAMAAAIAALGGATSGAAAAPITPPEPLLTNFTPARSLCEAQGGTFEIHEEPDGYLCRFSPSGLLTPNELRTARRLCEGAYKGGWNEFDTVFSRVYGCSFISQ